ncbi:hypothetical protein R1flu_009855 [Riccia fluitans]|uniref:Tubulin--tyrosine ligase-like protein 12 SET-like domain-containing protein n=1 Tax=Riccia fluitans TaxID=41844 RepID=A0ABD1Z3B8_9MARC
MEPCEDSRQRRLVLTCDRLDRESQVFLVDHAWSFRLTEARKQLKTVNGQAECMATLMCVVDQLEEEDGGESEAEGQTDAEAVVESAKRKAQEASTKVKWLEFDSFDITDDKLLSLGLSTNFPDLVGLSLWGTKVESLDALIEAIRGLPSLRVLWINQTPLDDKLGSAAKDSIIKALPKLELYNRHFTKSCSKWGLGFCAEIYGPENPVECSDPLEEVTDLDLSDRALLKLDPEVFSPLVIPDLINLNIKRNPLNQSSASFFNSLRAFKSLQSLQVDIPEPLGNSAVEIAKALPNLRSINGVEVNLLLKKGMEILDSNLKPGEPLVDRVLRAMRNYVMTYRLADEEKLDETPDWCIQTYEDVCSSKW